MALEVNIEKKLDGFTLRADFTVDREPFALLGASGSGKSMTLKCIAGIEKPDRGTIILDGRVLFDSERGINLRPQARRVGYMFQDYALFPNMTVLENVLTGMRCKESRDLNGRGMRSRQGRDTDRSGSRTRRSRRPGREEALPYLRKCQIEDLADINVTRLSGGQKQRAAMARILAQQPDCILLDEPFSALDTFLKYQMEEEMSSFLASSGVPVIFVTHSRDEVIHLCKKAACLTDGAAGKVQSVYDLFHHPATTAEARLSGCRNISRAIRQDAHTLAAADWGVTFHPAGEIPEGTNAVGLRAHFLYTSPTKETDLCLPVVSAREISDPFEHRILLKASADGAVIEYLAPRQKSDHFTIPKALYFSSDDLMYLQDKEG